MQVADVERVQTATARGPVHRIDRGVPVHEGRTDAERDHRQTLRVERISGRDFPSGELGIGDDRLGGEGAPTVERPAQGVPAVRIPLRVARVAAVVNGQHDWPQSPGRRGVCRTVIQIHGRSPGRHGQREGRPA